MKVSLHVVPALIAAMTVGLLTGAPFARAVTVADSAADFPVPDNATGDPKQGTNGWTYGYHVDPVAAGSSYTAGDFIAFPENAGPNTSPTDYWTGSKWDWHAGNPPWTEVTSTGGHPNGTNNGAEHWAIRRWTSDVRGAANLTFNVAKSNVGGGNGVTARLLVNGSEQSSITIGGTDGVGKTWTVHLPAINMGDQIDFALDPTGPDGVPNDGSDGSFFGGSVELVKNLSTLMLADSQADFPAPDTTSSDPKQGTNNWFYGYHNVTANGGYDAQPAGTDDFLAFPDNEGPGLSATDFWAGSAWDWTNGNPPWTTIGALDGHPNGANNAGAGGEHWAIRRYVAEAGGELFVETYFAKQNLSGGDGIIGRLFHNGAELYTQAVAGGDGTGDTAVTLIPNVKPGDFIDLVLDAGAADSFDGSAFSARVFVATPEPASAGLALISVAALAVRRRRAA